MWGLSSLRLSLAPEGRALCWSRIVFLKKVLALTTCGYGRSLVISTSQLLGCSSDTEVFSDQGIPSFSNPFELLQVRIG